MQTDVAFCGKATSIYLPASRGTEAPNIRLTHFQYVSLDEACARNTEHFHDIRATRFVAGTHQAMR